MIKSIAGLCLSFLLASVAMAETLTAGQPAPDFALPDQYGKQHRLADYRGRWVVLYFYPKDDTPGCTREACSFRDNISSLSDRGAVVLGISVDDSDSHAEFAKKYHLPFPLLADKGGKVAEKYDSLRNLIVIRLARRHSFLIDPEGRIARAWRNVNPATHVAEIVRDLKELQSP